MIRLRTLAALACCLVVASRAHAAPLDDLERQIRDVVTQRQTSEQERSRLMLEAAALSDAISAAQASSGARSRANTSLERQLRDFDRLAGQLDSVDRAIKNHDATIARLRRAFSSELDKLTRELSQVDARTSAARAAELEAARRRIDELIAPSTAFRPLLVVRPGAADTVADLDQKLAVLAAEQARGTEALSAFDRDLAVLGGRALLTRQLLDGLESAARGAPQDLRLVQRQVNEVQANLRDLDVKRTEVRRVRDALVAGLTDLEQQVRECRARRATLIRG